MQMTPPLLAKGVYSLVAPFSADPTVLYTCAAIRTFADCQQSGLDVFKTFYEPVGLTQVDYSRDLQAGINIITLLSDQPAIHVPDSYIESYPSTAVIPYSHIVLSVSLGALPDYLNLSNVQSSVAAVVSDLVGVELKVSVHKAPTSDVVSSAQRDSAEAARMAAITRRTTYYAENLTLKAQVNALLEQNKILSDLLKSNGII